MAKLRVNGRIVSGKGNPFGSTSVLAKETVKKLRITKPEVVGKIRRVNESFTEGSYRKSCNYYVEESYRSGGKKKEEFKGFDSNETMRITQMTGFGMGALEEKRLILEEEQEKWVKTQKRIAEEIDKDFCKVMAKRRKRAEEEELLLMYQKITEEMKSDSSEVRKPLTKKLEWKLPNLPNREIVEEEMEEEVEMEETFPGMRIAQLAKATRDESVEGIITILKKREQEEDAALEEKERQKNEATDKLESSLSTVSSSKEPIPVIGLNSPEELESSSHLKGIVGPSEHSASTSEKTILMIKLDPDDMSPDESMRSPSVDSGHIEEIVANSEPSEPSASTSRKTIQMIKLDPDDMSPGEMMNPSVVPGHLEKIAANSESSESSASTLKETTPPTKLGTGATSPEEMISTLVVPEDLEEIAENSESSEAMTPHSDMTSDAVLWSPSPTVSDAIDESSSDSSSLEEIELTVVHQLEILASGSLEATDHFGSSPSSSTSEESTSSTELDTGAEPLSLQVQTPTLVLRECHELYPVPANWQLQQFQNKPVLTKRGSPTATLPSCYKQFYNSDGLSAVRSLECNRLTLVSTQGAENYTIQLPTPKNYSSFTAGDTPISLPVVDQPTRPVTTSAEHYNLENQRYSYNYNCNYIINMPSCDVTSTNGSSRTMDNSSNYPRAPLHPKTGNNAKSLTRRNHSELLSKSRGKEPELVVLD